MKTVLGPAPTLRVWLTPGRYQCVFVVFLQINRGSKILYNLNFFFSFGSLSAYKCGLSSHSSRENKSTLFSLLSFLHCFRPLQILSLLHSLYRFKMNSKIFSSYSHKSAMLSFYFSWKIKTNRKYKRFSTSTASSYLFELH